MMSNLSAWVYFSTEKSLKGGVYEEFSDKKIDCGS
jgi:hypothetical protein